MSSGYILIVAILILGGAIAASGDRIGTKVGKARLSLFNLRPRQTATLVTIVTGSLIAASTLGVIFAASKPLRTGVFHLNQIQNKLSKTRKELAQVIEQKNQVENELAKVKSQQGDAQNLLNGIDQSLKAEIAKQSLTARQLNNTQNQLKVVSQQKYALGSEIQKLQQERQESIEQRDRVKEQVTQLHSQLNQLTSEITQLKAQVTQQDKEINYKNLNLAERDRVIIQRQELEKNLKKGISERQNRLAALATQLEEREKQLSQQNAQLQALEQQLNDRQAQLTQRDRQFQDLEQQFSEREAQLQQRDKQLKELEAQFQERSQRLSFLEQQIGNLEEDYQVLRQGNVALVRGQVLASGVLRIVEPTAARRAIDQLLSQANRTAIEATLPGSNNTNQRVVQITKAQVEQLLNQIKDGRDYVVRIYAAGNYILGEKQVQVLTDVAVNQVVFSAGDVVAQMSTEPTKMTEEEMRKRIDQLLIASQFRARRAGIIDDKIQIGDGRITTLIRFLEQLKQYNQPVDLQAVAVVDTYTAGPIKINLVAIQNGQVIFST